MAMKKKSRKEATLEALVELADAEKIRLGVEELKRSGGIVEELSEIDAKIRMIQKPKAR